MLSSTPSPTLVRIFKNSGLVLFDKFQMQCCKFEHAAGAFKDEQVQLNVCIPSIFEQI